MKQCGPLLAGGGTATPIDFPHQYNGGRQAKVQEDIPRWIDCRMVILTQTKPLTDIDVCVTPNLISLSKNIYVSWFLWVKNLE